MQLLILPVIQSPKIKQKIFLKAYTFFERSDHERRIIETSVTTWKFFSFRMKNHIFHSSNVTVSEPL